MHINKYIYIVYCLSLFIFKLVNTNIRFYYALPQMWVGYYPCLSVHMWGGGLGPVVMSLASQVEGSSHGATWPELKLAAFFPSGPRWQMWLEHRANYYMPPTTTYLYTCMHVGKYVSDLLKVGGFLKVLRFPPPIKLTATPWPKMLKVAKNTNQSITLKFKAPIHQQAGPIFHLIRASCV